ncbi:MAG: ROK family protein [Micrococcales bacterium]|nr:ROK family protein [Actinomycetota bacterium]NCA07128.1 ROK family protein [Micrococcales bacterium]
MSKKAIGIDIGGTGIKGAVVDVKSGKLLSERFRYPTPEGGSPKAIANTLRELIKNLPNPQGLPVGICFPAVVKNGVTMSAANVSREWIGLDADRLFQRELKTTVHVLNDADAAGLAEAKYGSASKQKGLVIVTTLGTGIGTALIYNGKLIPNSELGHLEISGIDYETKAAFSAKERENLTWAQWTKRLQTYYTALEALLTPDLFIVGGGVSKEHDQFLPLLKLKTPIVPAFNRNSAGIMGAAYWAKKHTTD